MIAADTDRQLETMEQPLSATASGGRFTLGLPSGLGCGERRFPLTPEGAALLAEKGVDVKVEEGAGCAIHYTDAAYARAGARVVTRAETLRADVVISLAALSPAEVSGMRRGSVLLTLGQSVMDNAGSAAALLRQGVLTVAVERIEDRGSNRPIADILHEIDGCASMAIASALLTDPVHGKGILLGGVTGIVPCEVTVLGSGMGAIAAAHNALGLGATVRMFDNDLYSLRQAARVLRHEVIGSALHPHVLESALRTADVVVATPMSSPFVASADLESVMKRRVLVFDLNPCPGRVFPSLSTFNLGEIAEREQAATTDRACYVNVGCQVPRTAAMALSNAIVGFAGELMSMTSAHKAESVFLTAPGMRPAVLAMFGKVVDRELARILGVSCMDINLFTSLS